MHHCCALVSASAVLDIALHEGPLGFSRAASLQWELPSTESLAGFGLNYSIKGKLEVLGAQSYFDYMCMVSWQVWTRRLFVNATACTVAGQCVGV